VPKPIVLTRDDWIEIDSALASKAAMLRRGDYGPCLEHTRRPCSCDKTWAAHLKAIAQTIGPDGTIAATCGVAPLVANSHAATTDRGKQ
jgi:hypothetical protein